VTKNFEPDHNLVQFVCDHLVDSSEAARMIGVTQTSIHRYVRNEELFGVKVGYSLLLLRSEVEKFEPKKAGRPKRNF